MSEERDPFDYERIVEFHGRDENARVVKLALDRVGRQIHALIKDAGTFVMPIDGKLWVKMELGISHRRG